MSDAKPPIEPHALFKDPDKLVSDLNSCCMFQIPDDLARVAVMWVARILADQEIALDKDGNPRTARVREKTAAAKLLVNFQSANLRQQALIANIKGLTTSLTVDGKVALDLTQLYRDTGIIDVDPIQQRLDQERNSGGKGLTGGNGNGKPNGDKQ